MDPKVRRYNIIETASYMVEAESIEEAKKLFLTKNIGAYFVGVEDREISCDGLPAEEGEGSF